MFRWHSDALFFSHNAKKSPRLSWAEQGSKVSWLCRITPIFCASFLRLHHPSIIPAFSACSIGRETSQYPSLLSCVASFAGGAVACSFGKWPENAPPGDTNVTSLPTPGWSSLTSTYSYGAFTVGCEQPGVQGIDPQPFYANHACIIYIYSRRRTQLSKLKHHGEKRTNQQFFNGSPALLSGFLSSCSLLMQAYPKVEGGKTAENHGSCIQERGVKYLVQIRQ